MVSVSFLHGRLGKIEVERCLMKHGQLGILQNFQALDKFEKSAYGLRWFGPDFAEVEKLPWFPRLTRSYRQSLEPVSPRRRWILD